jgi:hypothetical protein
MPPGFTSQRVVSINQIKSPLVGLVSCAIQSPFFAHKYPAQGRLGLPL